MKKLKFAKATNPPKLALPKLWPLPIILAAFNGALALAQLATFETFVMIIDSYNLAPGSAATALALIITALEILSLPVLLRLKLSPAMRFVSAGTVILTPLLWVQLTIWPFLNNFQLVNPGYFGSFLGQPYGWWLILEVLAYLALSFAALRILGGDELLTKK